MLYCRSRKFALQGWHRIVPWAPSRRRFHHWYLQTTWSSLFDAYLALMCQFMWEFMLSRRSSSYSERSNFIAVNRASHSILPCEIIQNKTRFLSDFWSVSLPTVLFFESTSRTTIMDVYVHGVCHSIYREAFAPVFMFRLQNSIRLSKLSSYSRLLFLTVIRRHKQTNN